MKTFWIGIVLAAGATGWGPTGWAQTHKVAKPQNVVRAVGVYEWTGDMAKPTASRLVPVSVFIEGKLEDGGVYLARPVPFALLSGNVYELQLSGVPKGLLDLVYSRHMSSIDTTTGATAYDDGWFGYGAFKGLPAARRTATTLRASKTLPVIQGSKDSDRPHFATKGGSDTASTAGAGTGTTGTAKSTGGDAGTTQASGSGDAKVDDPDRPVMHRRDGSGSSSGGSSGGSSNGSAGSADTSVPADDPDRPVLKKKSSGSDTADSSGSGGSGSGSSGSSQSGSSSASTDDADRPTMHRKDSSDSASTDSGSGSSGGGGDPANDPDRPTLKRRSAEDARRANRGTGDSVSEVGSLNNDPDRPNLHRGKPTSALTETDLPKLTGLPKDVELKQMVAVSDAANRPVHDFTRPWDDDTEKAMVLGKMETMARAQLAGYVASTGAVGTPPAAAPAKAPVKKTGSGTTGKSKLKHAAPAAPAPIALQDESLRGFLLSYGGLPTYVYSARAVGTGGALEYVTIVAQADAIGELKAAIQSVTDAAHLDRTPRMRLVDAVDAEASNRASLLFEMREQGSRQFALYRVIGAQAEQTFLTGTTQ